MKAHENRHKTHSYTSLAPSTAGTGHSTCCFGSLQRDPHSGTRGRPWVRHTKEQQQVSLAEKELFQEEWKVQERGESERRLTCGSCWRYLCTGCARGSPCTGLQKPLLCPRAEVTASTQTDTLNAFNDCILVTLMILTALDNFIWWISLIFWKAGEGTYLFGEKGLDDLLPTAFSLFVRCHLIVLLNHNSVTL